MRDSDYPYFLSLNNIFYLTILYNLKGKNTKNDIKLKVKNEKLKVYIYTTLNQIFIIFYKQRKIKKIYKN